MLFFLAECIRQTFSNDCACPIPIRSAIHTKAPLMLQQCCALVIERLETMNSGSMINSPPIDFPGVKQNGAPLSAFRTNSGTLEQRWKHKEAAMSLIKSSAVDT
jgi:hypothetical protein